jgi:hypothetical protein
MLGTGYQLYSPSPSSLGSVKERVCVWRVGLCSHLHSSKDTGKPVPAHHCGAAADGARSPQQEAVHDRLQDWEEI